MGAQSSTVQPKVVTVSRGRGGLTKSVIEGRVLERVALALNSSLALDDVLAALAEVTREVTAAGRVSVFTWDDGRLVPAVTRGGEPNAELWEAFRTIGPVELSAEQAAIARGRQALGIPDAAAEPLISTEWVERFGLQSLALVPLHALDEPFGVLVVDYPDRRSFADDELAALEAIGNCAGVAARNAELYEQAQRRARLQGAVAQAAADLAVPAAPAVVATRVAAAFDALAGEPGSVVWRLEPDAGRLVRLSPPRDGDAGAVDLSVLPDDVRRRLPLTRPAALGSAQLLQTAEIAPLAGGEGRSLVVPLAVEGRTVGLVVVRADRPGALDGEAREAAEVLAALGGAALERHELLEVRGHQARQLAILYELTAALADRADAEGLCAHLGELLAPEGYEVTGVAFRQRDLARHLGGDAPTAEEQESWEGDGWSSGDGGVGVPLRLGDRVVGTLRVRLPEQRPPAWRAFLEALGSGVAQLAARTALRAALEQSHRERALSQERERIAAEVHETVGAALETIDARLRRVTDELPADLPERGQVAATARLADGAKWHLEQAIRALAFVPTAQRGLGAALRGLAGQVEADSGIAVVVEVEGRPARLPGRVERALYRVASEGLAAAWRYARCSVVAVELAYARDEVVLRVRDDGVGLAQRQERGAPAATLHALRRAVTDVGGQLELRPVSPHGMELEVTVPRGRRASTA